MTRLQCVPMDSISYNGARSEYRLSQHNTLRISIQICDDIDIRDPHRNTKYYIVVPKRLYQHI